MMLNSQGPLMNIPTELPPIVNAPGLPCVSGQIATFRARAPHAHSSEFIQPFQRDATCPVCSGKIYPFLPGPNHTYKARHPVPIEGRFAIVTDVGAGCGGRKRRARRARRLRTAKPCGPDAPTLASSLAGLDPQATVAKKPGRRGELGISR
jgi:hypothetical protein